MSMFISVCGQSSAPGSIAFPWIHLSFSVGICSLNVSHRKATFFSSKCVSKTAAMRWCEVLTNAYPTSFIVILATKIPNKQKISVAKTTDLLTNHIWRKNCILISFQLHPLLRSAPTLQPALASCFFFPGLVIHLGLCGTLFQSIDATSLSAKELRNTLLRCCFCEVRNQRLRAAHKRWRFKSCKKGTVHLKGTAKNTKTLVFAVPLYWQ